MEVARRNFDSPPTKCFAGGMRLFVLTTVLFFFVGCSSKSRNSQSTENPYKQLAKAYIDKIDKIWMNKIKDVPDFASGFAKCTNDYEIAKWMEKNLSNEIDWYTKQLQNDLHNYHISKGASFVTDKKFMDALLEKCAKTFRSDLVRIYVHRHEYYKNEGYFD